jgi:hypothetical protein
MDFPEAGLWHAVILQALGDLGNKQLRQQALHWFLSSSGHVGSFLWVCYHINLDPDAARKAALNSSPLESFAANNGFPGAAGARVPPRLNPSVNSTIELISPSTESPTDDKPTTLVMEPQI